MSSLPRRFVPTRRQVHVSARQAMTTRSPLPALNRSVFTMLYIIMVMQLQRNCCHFHRITPHHDEHFHLISTVVFSAVLLSGPYTPEVNIALTAWCIFNGQELLLWLPPRHCCSYCVSSGVCSYPGLQQRCTSCSFVSQKSTMQVLSNVFIWNCGKNSNILKSVRVLLRCMTVHMASPQKQVGLRTSPSSVQFLDCIHVQSVNTK